MKNVSTPAHDLIDWEYWFSICWSRSNLLADHHLAIHMLPCFVGEIHADNGSMTLAKYILEKISNDMEGGKAPHVHT